MSNQQATELCSETTEIPFIGRKLESLDDIPREIADRRLHVEFGEFIAPEKSETVRNIPDVLETPEEFSESAKKVGLEDTRGILGWSTDLEAPAHVLKGDVGREIATLIHEDLHRFTHPETMRKMHENPALCDTYEGITEYLTQQAAEGLHGHEPGECYPEQVESARQLAAEVGEIELRKYFFQHEMADEVGKALKRYTEEAKIEKTA